MSKPILEIDGLTKSFGSVQALRGATFHVNEGEVVALLGDNGAGKSTLIKAISGRAKSSPCSATMAPANPRSSRRSPAFIRPRAVRYA